MTDVEMPPPKQGTAKRPRDGTEDVTANSSPAKRVTVVRVSHANDAPKPATSSPPIADAWTQAIDACHTAQVKVPPPRILEHFGTIRSDALKEFQDAQKQLQRALVTFERFDQASDCSAVPSIVSNAIKVPNLQLLKGTPDLDTNEPDVVLAKAIAADACDAARTAAIDYTRAVYTAQVTHCKAAVNTAKCADLLSANLTAYGKEIIESAPSGGGDPKIWDACILRLRTAFIAELTDLSFDFAAKIRTEALEKDSKANAVATARAAAETSSAARPIEELLKDNMRPYDKRIEDLEKKFQSATQTPTASSSKSHAKSSKTNASGKEKKPKPQADDKKARKEAKNDAKRTDADGKGASKKAKKQSKGKAKKEPQDSDSN